MAKHYCCEQLSLTYKYFMYSPTMTMHILPLVLKLVPAFLQLYSCIAAVALITTVLLLLLEVTLQRLLFQNETFIHFDNHLI